MPNEPSNQYGLDPTTREIYRKAMSVLNENEVPYLVGGAYAFAQYTGIERHTKDFDVFVRREDCPRALEALQAAGYRTELTFPHWLGKAYMDTNYIDVIYSSGNGVCNVDDQWFEHSTQGNVLGMIARLVPPEEMIWPKVFIMERERFDGADVAHILHACAGKINWNRLIDRMGDNWRVLLVHLIMYGYIYPAERNLIPEFVMERLVARLQSELGTNDLSAAKVCQGTLLSRAQYLPDIEANGYTDARVKPLGNMSTEEIAIWTAPVKESAA